MGEFTVKNRFSRYDLVYRDDGRGIMEVVKCVPHAGQKIYRLTGHYDKKAEPSSVFVFGRGKIDASHRYKDMFGWDAWSCAEVQNPDSIEHICTTPNIMPI